MWKTKISHILELYDGYTGQPADAGQFRIISSQKVTWIPKDNGCMVFCDCGYAEVGISLESRNYIEKQVLLEKKIEGQISVQRVWVFPGQAYISEKWEILKSGEAPSMCRVEYFPVMSTGALRLLQNVGKQDGYLHIFHRKHESLEGRRILLYPKLIRRILGKETEPFCFALEQSMEIEVKKTEACVSVGYEGITQADGSFQIAVPGKRSSLEKSIFYLEGQKQAVIHDNKEV